MNRFALILLECVKGLVFGTVLVFAILHFLIQNPDLYVFRYAGY